MASSNDRKETRSATVRLDPTVSVGAYPEHNTGNSPRDWRPDVARPDLGGTAAYPPGAMTAVCIMLEVGRTTYRKMVDMLRNNHTMAARMGLKKIPSKSTVARSYWMIPEWYWVKVHQTVIREMEAGSLAGDSTGYSYLRFVRRFDVRADKFRTKKGWVKIHAIVEIRTRHFLLLEHAQFPHKGNILWHPWAP